MTFEEWWGDKSADDMEIAITKVAKLTWHAATLAEREACAKLAERHFIPGHSIAGEHFAANLAEEIRARTKE